MTDPSLDAEITLDLLAISRHIDGEMRRTFVRDAVATPRIYLVSEPTIIIHTNDISEVPTEVAVDTAGDGTFATVIAPEHYDLLPLNADRGPEPWPFNYISLRPSSPLPMFPARQRVRVTARFGWPSVPLAIHRATIHLTAILRLESARATKRIPEMGDTVETSHQAQNIIRQLTNQYKVWLL